MSQLLFLHTCNSAEHLPQTGDASKARAAYQDFFALWKGADPDIPVLKQAKKEYARLKCPSMSGDFCHIFSL